MEREFRKWRWRARQQFRGVLLDQGFNDVIRAVIGQLLVFAVSADKPELDVLYDILEFFFNFFSQDNVPSRGINNQRLPSANHVF